MKRKNLIHSSIIAIMLIIGGVCAHAQEKKHSAFTDENGHIIRSGTPPKYKRGIPDIMEYLRRNVNYPPKHSKANEGGRVVVRFIVNKKGKVVHPVVIRSASPLMDAEAIRVIENMDDWTPAVDKDGKLKNASFVIPITYNTRRFGMIKLQPTIGHLDLTSIFGKKLSSFKLTGKVGDYVERKKRKEKEDCLYTYYYYDRGNDVIKTSKNRGLYYCKVGSKRFSLLDRAVEVGAKEPTGLEEYGWQLVKTEHKNKKRVTIKTYNVPDMKAQVVLMISNKKDVIYCFEISRLDELSKV